MSKKSKKFYPRKRALYSIQFYKDKDGFLNCTETCQGGKLDDLISMKLIGRDLVYSDLLNDEEKLCFYAFCSSYVERFLETRNLKEQNQWLNH